MQLAKETRTGGRLLSNALWRARTNDDCPREHCECTTPRWWLWLVPLALLALSLTLRRWWPREATLQSLGVATAWALMLAALLAMLMLLGWAWRGNPRGILVGSRQVASLSLLQLVAWTALICSAIVFVAIWQSHGLGGKPELDADGALIRPEDPLGDVAWQTAATVGTSAAAVGVLATKSRQVPRDDLLARRAKVAVSRAPKEAAGRLFDALGDAEDLQPTLADSKGLVLPKRLRPGIVGRRLEPTLAKLSRPGEPDLPQADVERVLDVTAELVVRFGKERVQGAYVRLLEGGEPDQWAAWLKASPALGAVLEGLGLERFRHAVKRLVQAGELETIRQGSRGTLFTNACPCQARLMDILEGDEVANNDNKEGSKIQFLLFTLAALVAYGAVMWHAFHDSGYAGLYLPSAPEHLTEIVTASGGGYLLGKVPSRST